MTLNTASNAPEIVVFLDDGIPLDVELFGLPKGTKVRVLNKVHPDDVEYKDEPLGTLTLSNGEVITEVEELTPDVRVTDAPSVFIAN